MLFMVGLYCKWCKALLCLSVYKELLKNLFPFSSFFSVFEDICCQLGVIHFFPGVFFQFYHLTTHKKHSNVMKNIYMFVMNEVFL